MEGTSPLTLALLLTILLLSVLYAYKKLTEEAYKVSLRLCKAPDRGTWHAEGFSSRSSCTSIDSRTSI